METDRLRQKDRDRQKDRQADADADQCGLRWMADRLARIYSYIDDFLYSTKVFYGGCRSHFGVDIYLQYMKYIYSYLIGSFLTVWFFKEPSAFLAVQ
jgi:hypothetical protein